MSVFADRLIKERDKVGLSQLSCSEKLGISRDTLSKWENDHRKPDIDELKKLCELFDCDADYLLGKQEEPNKEYQHIGEYTGIEYKSIENIIKAKKIPFFSEMLSNLLDDDNIHLLFQMIECCTANYGSVSTYIDMPDIFQSKKTKSLLIRPKQLRQADTMELYRELCDFVDKQRQLNNLPTSQEM